MATHHRPLSPAPWQMPGTPPNTPTSCPWRAQALAFLLALLLATLWPGAAHAKRVALVIGNAQYQNEKPLKNPVNDARALARTLKEDLKFDDVIERSNVTRRELGRLIDQLGQRAQGADAVVVYYSGHGMQGAGGNYLIPVDAQITSTEDIKLEGVSANDVVDVLNQSGARVALLVLDACRDNPFRTRTKSGSKGLARMNVSGGNLLVAYATQEGDTADDGLGNNSPYAQALVQNLKRKDLRVLEVFDEVAQQVKTSTAQKQRPTRYGDLPVNVYLTGAPTVVASIDPVPTRPGPRMPTGGAANFGDLEQAQREEAAARQKWAEWQARMKADFNKVSGFNGSAELEAKGWERFLAAYVEDNPFSTDDEKWRQEARARLDALSRLRRETAVVAAPVPQTSQAAGRAGYVWPSAASEVVGAGATFPAPLYSKWAADYAASTGGRLSYQAIGSGAGIKQIKARTVDFGASDMPLRKAELDQDGLLQFPTALGGVAVVVNINGVNSASLRLTGRVLADIFLGKIVHWNDPAIAELNPRLSLPDAQINVVRRADGSGTTFLFTNYLSKVSDEWRTNVGEGTAVNWPIGAGGKGNEGVTAFLTRLPNSIAYVEFAYVEHNRLTTVLLKNADGNFIGPSMNSIQAAAAGFDWSDPNQYPVLTNQRGAGSWPIAGASFVLLPRTADDESHTVAVLKFFDWAYRNGQQAADQLQYVGLPVAVINHIEASWSDLRQRSGRPLLARTN